MTDEMMSLRTLLEKSSDADFAARDGGVCALTYPLWFVTSHCCSIPSGATATECGALKVEVLVVGRDPRIPDQHRNFVANIVVKR
jgi:hypothetical protein